MHQYYQAVQPAGSEKVQVQEEDVTFKFPFTAQASQPVKTNSTWQTVALVKQTSYFYLSRLILILFECPFFCVCAKESAV